MLLSPEHRPAGCTLVPKSIVALDAQSDGTYAILYDDDSLPKQRVLWQSGVPIGRQVVLQGLGASVSRASVDASVSIDSDGQALTNGELARQDLVAIEVVLGRDDSIWRQPVAASGNAGLMWISTGLSSLSNSGSLFMSALGQSVYSATGTPHWVTMYSPSRAELPSGFALMSGAQSSLNVLLSPELAAAELSWHAIGTVKPSGSGRHVAATILTESQTQSRSVSAWNVSTEASTGQRSSLRKLAGAHTEATSDAGTLVWDSIRFASVSEDQCNPFGAAFLTGFASGRGVVTKDNVVVLQEGDQVLDFAGATFGLYRIAGAGYGLSSNANGDYAAAVPVSLPNASPHIAIFLNSRMIIARGMQVGNNMVITHVYPKFALAQRTNLTTAFLISKVKIAPIAGGTSMEAVVSWIGDVVRIGGCLGDYDGSGAADGDDVILYFSDWDAGEEAADLDCSGSVDGDDIILFFQHWDLGC